MRYFLSVLMIGFTITFAYSQTDEPKTELLIIGTIHTGNKHFNHKTLYKALRKHKPDVILWEQNEDFKRVYGLSTASFLGIWKPGIEQLSLQRFSRHHKTIPILPFDTSFTSRKNFLRQLLRVEEDFLNDLSTANMSPEDSIHFINYIKNRNNYYEVLLDADLVRLNKPDIMDSTRTLYHLEQHTILPLGKKYIRDSLLISQYENNLSFWVARNNYMANQINSYSRQFKGQRIIILTGLNHKYYLQDKLLENNNNPVKLIELQE